MKTKSVLKQPTSATPVRCCSYGTYVTRWTDLKCTQEHIRAQAFVHSRTNPKYIVYTNAYTPVNFYCLACWTNLHIDRVATHLKCVLLMCATAILPSFLHLFLSCSLVRTSSLSLYLGPFPFLFLTIPRFSPSLIPL